MSTSKDGLIKIIPKEKSSDFQSWKLPNVEYNGLDLEEKLPMITATKNKNIHQQAYLPVIRMGAFDAGKTQHDLGLHLTRFGDQG